MDLTPKVAPRPPGSIPCYTVHGAKGLEFDHVYLIGMAQEVFPSFQALKSPRRERAMEEERRSCFVAITRAQETLTINGQLLPSFHFISHRIYSDGAEGEAIEGAYEMHNAIDRLFAGMFDHLLSRLDEHGVLDNSVAVWCNDLGNGPSHSYDNVPYILVGGAGGALNTGYFHDLGGVTNNKLFNSIATAVGVTAEDGGPVTTFGDESLEPGLIEEIMA
jgi:hypothetical protein